MLLTSVEMAACLVLISVEKAKPFQSKLAVNQALALRMTMLMLS